MTMTRLEAYSTLERLGPVVRTAEAAAALRMSVRSATRLLQGLAGLGRARSLRNGVWFVGPGEPDPFTIVSDLTRPYPSYVSFASALSYHAMIDQVPREFSVASLDRARRIETSLGTFAVHHLAPELFGGWDETSRGRVATPEKAIFDLSYVAAVHSGRPRRVPEIDLPAKFDAGAIDAWVAQIASPRVATMTRRGVEYTLSRVVR